MPSSTYPLNNVKDWQEDIRIIIAHFVLKYRGQTFKTQAHINMLCRKRFKRAISLPIELLPGKQISHINTDFMVIEQDCMLRWIPVPTNHYNTWIKTRFHISTQVGSSLLTNDAASRLPILSKCISVQGPQGPVSPISQKLSYPKIQI